MRSLYRITLALFFVALMGCSADEQAERHYHLASGEQISFSDLEGKVVLINYWAEWCSPCREEIPELNALQHQFVDEVVVLGVNFDGLVGEELAAQAKKMGIEFALLEDDPREEFGVAPSGVLPETLVIDRRGEFQQVLLGPQSLSSLQHVVASLPEEMNLSQ